MKVLQNIQNFVNSRSEQLEETHYLVKCECGKLMTLFFHAIVSISSIRKIMFNSPDEKRTAADKIVTEAEQINKTFTQLCADLELPDECKNVLPAMAEILKMGDTSMMALELSVSCL